MQRRTRIIGVVATVTLAIGAGVAAGGYAVATNEEWTNAADRRIAREDERDAVRKDVQRQEAHLKELGTSIGSDPTPVRDEPIEYPKGTDETVLGGDSVIGDFTDIFIDEGIVLQGVDAEEVDELPLRPAGTLPPTPQKPVRPKPGSRLVKVTLRVTNRSGDGADPACGLANGLNAFAYNDKGKRVQIADIYDAVGTYTTSCGAGIADGTSADIVMGVGLAKGERLTSMQFLFLGRGDSDKFAPLLVFQKPV